MTQRFVRRKVEDEEIVIDLQSGEFYGLNEAAAARLSTSLPAIAAPWGATQR